MKGEERYPTYYAFLGLFTFSMLGLVLSSNLFQIYIFWELVGVSSFLLIGFYYNKPSAVAACKKAFIVTRFADLGFLIGILILSFYSGTLDFQTLITRLNHREVHCIKQCFGAVISGYFCIDLGTGADIYRWLPVKAPCFPCISGCPMRWKVLLLFQHLIHAATMVVAGVFLVARLFPVFAITAPDVLGIDRMGWCNISHHRRNHCLYTNRY